MYKTGAVVAVVVAVFIAMLSMLQEQEGHGAASIPLPGTLVPILGGWARDPRRVNAARKAIRGGRAVVIQGAFNTSLASAMRNELAAMQWGRDDRSTSAADLPAPSLFLNAPIAPEFREKSACLSIMARTEGRPFFFSHQQLLSEGATAQWPSDSATLRFSEALLSSELRDWVETTLFDGSELGNTGTAVRLMTPGDMYGPHTDATDHPAAWAVNVGLLRESDLAEGVWGKVCLVYEQFEREFRGSRIRATFFQHRHPVPRRSRHGAFCGARCCRCSS